jgi:hypothetical protein
MDERIILRLILENSMGVYGQINLAQDWNKRRAFVKILIKLQFP